MKFLKYSTNKILYIDIIFEYLQFNYTIVSRLTEKV
jgi:hypothetical protein